MMKIIKEKLKKIKLLYEPWHQIREMIGENREKKKVNAYKKYGHAILADVSDIMIKNRIPCVCIDGTLLGLVRDGCLIPWDDDLDFAIIDHGHFQWNIFEKHMEKAGFWKYREIEEEGAVTAQSYKKRNVLCDFSLWPFTGQEIKVSYGCYEIPKYQYINGKVNRYRIWYKTVPPIKKVSYRSYSGIKVQIPENYEEILFALYGENWRTPDPDFHIEKEVTEKEYRFTYYRKRLFKGILL